MSFEMFVVGAVLFALYIYLTIWNVTYNNKKQGQEDQSNKADLPIDELDSDGMGNFSRFPKEEKK
ncbi:MAG: hypothetical protein QNK59_04010 [Flavobacteriales bacterium]|jgi:hypothetical protein|nr:hypothetical protein [Schleiferiaceae bacterium]|tara:strand:+ start:430 stop:624 length:195 start_codon:yes stop_codon:yes gene_type:complete